MPGTGSPEPAPARQLRDAPAAAAQSAAAGKNSAELPAAAISRLRPGAELRRLRDAAALRLQDVAAALEVAPSTLSRIENGLAPARASYVRDMLDIYGVTDDGHRRRLTDMARDGRRAGWWADYDDVLATGAGTYLGLESAARSVRSFSALAVPDLLQADDYAEALCRAACPYLDARQVRTRAGLKNRRQEARRDLQRRAHLIADEAALLRVIGSPPVMARQLDHLTAACADPMLTIQVLPLSRAHPILASSFTVLSFAEPGTPDVACRGDIHGPVTIVRRHQEVAGLIDAFKALAQSALPPLESAGLIMRLAEKKATRIVAD
ncbi:MAG TPA: helix-turn-helix transcriptional regulator [Streptosporangiaceae bacterium]|nr:helix-turn-helix transcriptional regulator [Streptosporangiaceae bacterium]